ncbi:MAG: hypothetical protein LBU04_07145, partial [Christensenellaceae bacterium]|nr:hypothetical protein [Christensenellaceae bacterium]
MKFKNTNMPKKATIFVMSIFALFLISIVFLCAPLLNNTAQLASATVEFENNDETLKKEILEPPANADDPYGKALTVAQDGRTSVLLKTFSDSGGTLKFYFFYTTNSNFGGRVTNVDDAAIYLGIEEENYNAPYKVKGGIYVNGVWVSSFSEGISEKNKVVKLGSIPADRLKSATGIGGEIVNTVELKNVSIPYLEEYGIFGQYNTRQISDIASATFSYWGGAPGLFGIGAPGDIAIEDFFAWPLIVLSLSELGRIPYEEVDFSRYSFSSDAAYETVFFWTRGLAPITYTLKKGNTGILSGEVNMVGEHDAGVLGWLDGFSYGDGQYTLTIIDGLNKDTSVSFNIDTTAPVISGAKAFYASNEAITINIYDTHIKYWNFDGGARSLSNSTYYKNSNDLSEGQHVIYAEDTVGHNTTVSFVVDKTNPTLTTSLSSSVTADGYTNGPFTVSKNIETNWNRLYWRYSSTKLTGSITNSTTGYTESNSKTINVSDRDGWYYFWAVDKAGNVSAIYSVLFDRVNPEVTGIKSFYKENETVLGTIIETEFLEWQLDGVKKSGSSIAVVVDNKVADGEHTIKVIDRSGNYCSVVFTVDKTNPTLKSSTVSNESYTSSPFTIEKDVENNWASLYWKYGESRLLVSKDSYNGVTTETSITIDENIQGGLKDGWYSFLAIDKAGNTSVIYYVCLDKKKPVVAGIKSFYKENEIISGTITETN